MKLVQYNECLISIVDTDGLVLYHQGISNHKYQIAKDFTEICSKRSNWQYSIIGSDNGLTPFIQQGIIWTNDG